MISIEKISSAHLDAWQDYRNKLYGEIDPEISAFDLQRFQEAEDQDCFLAIENGVAIGFIEVTLRNLVDGCRSSPVGYLEGIYVDETARGRGIGQLLLETAENWARGHGCIEFASDSTLEDRSAQEFHLHAGFEETERIVQFRKNLTSPAAKTTTCH